MRLYICCRLIGDSALKFSHSRTQISNWIIASIHDREEVTETLGPIINCYNSELTHVLLITDLQKLVTWPCLNTKGSGMVFVSWSWKGMKQNISQTALMTSNTNNNKCYFILCFYQLTMF